LSQKEKVAPVFVFYAVSNLASRVAEAAEFSYSLRSPFIFQPVFNEEGWEKQLPGERPRETAETPHTSSSQENPQGNCFFCY
jgi:hypothetical protein